MTVRQLIEELQSKDPEAEVCVSHKEWDIKLVQNWDDKVILK